MKSARIILNDDYGKAFLENMLPKINARSNAHIVKINEVEYEVFALEEDILDDVLNIISQQYYCVIDKFY